MNYNNVFIDSENINEMFYAKFQMQYETRIINDVTSRKDLFLFSTVARFENVHSAVRLAAGIVFKQRYEKTAIVRRA